MRQFLTKEQLSPEVRGALIVAASTILAAILGVVLQKLL
jgi:hypothetical protein